MHGFVKRNPLLLQNHKICGKMSQSVKERDCVLKRITNIPFKLVVSACIALYVVVMYLSPWSCPVLDLTGIRCLGCGMTRAWLAALRLDLPAAFSYHAMFWSVPLLYLSFLLDGKLFRQRRLNLFFHIAILVGFVLNWIFHQFF